MNIHIIIPSCSFPVITTMVGKIRITPLPFHLVQRKSRSLCIKNPLFNRLPYNKKIDYIIFFLFYKFIVYGICNNSKYRKYKKLRYCSYTEAFFIVQHTGHPFIAEKDPGKLPGILARLIGNNGYILLNVVDSI